MALRVLRLPELVRAIADFQQGVPLDVKLLRALVKGDGDTRNVKTALAPFHAFFEPWLAQHTRATDLTPLLQSDPSTRFRLTQYAIAYSNVRLLDNLCDLDINGDDWILAARLGNVGVLAYFIERKQPTYVPLAMAHALRTGQAPVVEYLHGQGGTIPPFASSVACNGGHLALVKLLRHLDAWRPVNPSLVAKQGHLDVLKYLHEQGCGGFTAETMDEAAAAGRLEIVRDARPMPSPVPRKTALGRRSLPSTVTGPSVVRLVADFAKPKSSAHQRSVHSPPTRYGSPRVEAATDAEAVDFRRNNGFPLWTAHVLLTAIRQDRLDIVAYANEHKLGVFSTAAMDNAGRFGCLEIFRYLHTHRREGCTKAAWTGAVANGHLGVVRYMVENDFAVVDLKVGRQLAISSGRTSLTSYIKSVGPARSSCAVQ
ncbi:hypothetical protein SPRG_15647 [Saprolegnia parasitica CBS 223.65]|uniref:Uncharacterized protein n=1 Tax=Saprolegnia parasitica (strain CBS 223.65) TaxID=695850 RepID=A0A067BL90_SAPPC|nr:hypothetical protein SPRG_15647 [Saprolegnia parasitica CBS 223.65]KDO19204.1 hypothetical protein SPRG_15647 [Saprolegnia parasitica CBS 223.65]|eukprot:XP_012210070.1 hypothetical protein SPRG_15647 [Saprolegnia parasitica CBS 223.65]